MRFLYKHVICNSHPRCVCTIQKWKIDAQWNVPAKHFKKICYIICYMLLLHYFFLTFYNTNFNSGKNFSKFHGKVGVISWFLFHLIWKNYVLYWDFDLKSWIVDFFTRFTREKTPQNNFSSQNFSVENNYWLLKIINLLEKLFWKEYLSFLVCVFFHLAKFFRYIAVESTNYQQRIVFKVEKTAAVFLFLPNCSTLKPRYNKQVPQALFVHYIK